MRAKGIDLLSTAIILLGGFALTAPPAEAAVSDCDAHAGSGTSHGIQLCGGGGFCFTHEDGCFAYTCDDIEEGMGVDC